MSQYKQPDMFVPIILIFTLLGMSLSAMPISNRPIDLEEERTLSMTHSNISNLNFAGHQDDSVFSYSTISSGYHTTCVITEDTRVACWGKNEQGKRGLGGGLDNAINEPVGKAGPWLVGNLSVGMVEVSTGDYSSCSLTNNGEIWCWGGGEYGQLGTGTDLCTVSGDYSCTGATNHPPLQVVLPAGTSALSISDMGGEHACAILDTGDALCWGYNVNGQLGDGTVCSGGDWWQPNNNPSPAGCNAYDGRYLPVIVSKATLPSNSSFISISTGDSHTCGILDTNALYCWGNNFYGQLGFGNTTFSSTPRFVANDVVAVGTGRWHTCALDTDESVACWGNNDYGQLGIGNINDQYVPTPINLSSNISVISLEVGPHNSCIITDNFTPYCWGRNNWGQASAQQHHFHWGHDDRISPVELWHGDNQQIIPNYTGDWNNSAIAMSINDQAFCSIKMDAILVHGHTDVVCWGANFWGQRGNGSYPTNTYGGINYVNLSSSSIGGWNSVTIGALHLSERDLDSDSIISIYDDLPYGCPGGSYDPNFNGSCTQTSPGHYTPGFGHHSEIPCDLGTYQPDSGQSYCVESSPGHFVNGTGALTQNACPAGTYQPDYLQVSCIDASPGHSPNFESTSQEPCSFGYYQPDSGQSYCIASSPGSHVHNTGSLTQTECSPGTFQPNFGSSSCINALPGNYVPASNSTNQEVCSPGTYQPNYGSTSCLDAEPGHYVEGNGNSEQQSCPLGTFSTSIGAIGIETCIDAHSGHYVDTIGSDSQLECPAGSYNPQTGSISSNDCLSADIGNFVENPGSSTQTPCDFGFYQPSSGQTFCLESSSGTHIPNIGSSSAIDCVAGSYQPETGQAECLDADAGHYTSSPRALSQTPCLAGSYQPETGSVNCLQSDVGHHVPLEGQSFQTICPAGQYQPQTGSVECLVTNPGEYSFAGAISPLPCLAGSYQSESGQAACVLTHLGHFSNIISASEQISCQPGKYQPLTGQVECLDAERGHYVDSYAAIEQIPCPIGSYQTSIAATGCILASVDNFVPSTGMISQQVCPSGESQPLVGQASCNLNLEESGIPTFALIGGVVVFALIAVVTLMRPSSKPQGKKVSKKRRKVKKKQ